MQYYAKSLSPPPPAALGRPRWAFLVSGSRGRCDARLAGALYTVNERPDCGVRRVPQPSKAFPGSPLLPIVSFLPSTGSSTQRSDGDASW